MNVKINKIALMMLLIIPSTFVYSTEVNEEEKETKKVINYNLFDYVDFENYEIELSTGITSYDLDCEKCNSIYTMGAGISTSHNSDIFINVNLNQDESFKYRSGIDNYDLDSISLNTNLNYNFYRKENYNIYGGVGLSYWKNKTIGLNSDKVFSSSKYGLSPVLSVGAMYDINEDMSLGVKYKHKFDIEGYDNFKIKDMNSDSLLFTFTYKLPRSTKTIVDTVYKDNYIILEKEMSVFFEIDHHETTRLDALNDLLSAIERHPNKNYIIYINAHASKIGEKDYNIKLSSKRANFVEQKITERLLETDLDIKEKIIKHKYGFKYHSDNDPASQRVDIHISFF